LHLALLRDRRPAHRLSSFSWGSAEPSTDSTTPSWANVSSPRWCLHTVAEEQEREGLAARALRYQHDALPPGTRRREPDEEVAHSLRVDGLAAVAEQEVGRIVS